MCWAGRDLPQFKKLFTLCFCKNILDPKDNEQFSQFPPTNQETHCLLILQKGNLLQLLSIG